MCESVREHDVRFDLTCGGVGYEVAPIVIGDGRLSLLGGVGIGIEGGDELEVSEALVLRHCSDERALKKLCVSSLSLCIFFYGFVLTSFLFCARRLMRSRTWESDVARGTNHS